MRAQSHGRWEGLPAGAAADGVWGMAGAQELHGGGELLCCSRSALTSRTRTHTSQPRVSAAEYDHPSFDRPPHRSASQDSRPHQLVPPPQQQQPTLASPAEILLSTSAAPIEYDLVSNVSIVPPPPSIENSAVPLADLACEMVWEACILAVEAESSRSPSTMASWTRLTNKPPSLFNEVVEANTKLRYDSTAVNAAGMRTPPRTPELYGAIGEGRGRKVSAGSDDFSSGFSSPSSSGPATPAGIGAVEATSARKMKLAGLGFGFAPFGSDAKHDPSFSPESSMDAVSTRTRNMSTNRGRPFSQAVASTPAFPHEPTPAFRQFVKQILVATLVSPEDLVLALYYVARIPSTSVIQPSKPDQRDGANARANAVKAAPFKVFLGALMIANKVRVIFLSSFLCSAQSLTCPFLTQTLQDNSYRNETFAAVSGIPLKDVNDLEVFVFGSLGFDVAVRDDVWRTWLGVVCRRSQTKNGDLGDVISTGATLHRLVVLATNHNSPF